MDLRLRAMDSLMSRRFTARMPSLTPHPRGRVAPGQTLENPVTGERFTFTDTAATTNGVLLAFDFALRPGGSVPVPHVHPLQTERFEVLEGRMRFRIGLRRRTAGPGDVVEIPRGVAHSFANDGEQTARLRVQVRPALDMEDMLAEVVALAEAGRMTRRGLPRNPLELARLARTYEQVAHAPLLGVRVQRLLLSPLVFSARHPRAGLITAIAAVLGSGAVA
jgi:quercetin dioxygenase-like cupin family protein